jgi:hypothetical protein
MRALLTVHYVTVRSFAFSGLLSVPMSMTLPVVQLVLRVRKSLDTVFLSFSVLVLAADDVACLASTPEYPPIRQQKREPGPVFPRFLVSISSVRWHYKIK